MPWKCLRERCVSGAALRPTCRAACPCPCRSSVPSRREPWAEPTRADVGLEVDADVGFVAVQPGLADPFARQPPVEPLGDGQAAALSWPRIRERLAATDSTSRPWQAALTTVEHIRTPSTTATRLPHRPTSPHPPKPSTPCPCSPTPCREELCRAAAAFERASRSRVHAENQHAARLRGAVKDMLRTTPPTARMARSWPCSSTRSSSPSSTAR